MQKDKRSKGRGRCHAKPQFWPLVFFFMLGITALAAVLLAVELYSYGSARSEYNALRQQYAPDSAYALPAPETSPAPATPIPSEHTRATSAPNAAAGTPPPPGPTPPTPPTPEPTPKLSPQDALHEINQDYIGWLRIPGTAVDYPVVLGNDNSRYLSTSFQGRSNKLGAVFMDYRCGMGFDEPYAILYGHNARDGSMFAGLSAFLRNGYAQMHPTLTVFLPNGTERRYTVFSARKTDVTDHAYNLQGTTDDLLHVLGAPENTTHLLALSTCTSNAGSDERILLFAAAE